MCVFLKAESNHLYLNSVHNMFFSLFSSAYHNLYTPNLYGPKLIRINEALYSDKPWSI